MQKFKLEAKKRVKKRQVLKKKLSSVPQKPVIVDDGINSFIEDNLNGLSNEA